MNLLTLDNWPILVICVGMLAAAIIDWWKFKVPNKLTYPLILSGWLLGLAIDVGFVTGEGGFGAAVAGTALGFLLLLPIYSIGGMGAGDVKMTMGFGSWIGAFYGANGGPGQEGLWVIVYAFCAGAIVGGVIALGMIVIRGRYQENAQHLREIFGDLLRPKGGVGTIAEKANARRPRWHRLPYGVPLCIGFLGYLIYMSM
jgi:prepilin peptidase CpaA